MSVLPVTQFPDDILRQLSTPVTDFGKTLEAFTSDLVETLQHHGGIGLSAPQVGRSTRVIVTMSGQDRTPVIYINPVIKKQSRKGFVQESCLSLPGIVGNVTRFTSISVTAQNLDGSPFEKDLTGMDAVCIQHEIDHLNGILIIDRFTRLKKLTMQISNKWSGTSIWST